MAKSPITYPPAGMDRSRPVDRSCPLYTRCGGKDCCRRRWLCVDHYRELLMGCPEPCENRDEALKAPGARERYRLAKAWEDAS